MRKICLHILFIFLLATSCTNEKTPVRQELTAENQPAPVEENEKTLDVPWIAVFNDSTQLLQINRNPAAHPDKLNEQDIIDALNLKYPRIQLKALGHEGNKAIIQIENSTYLTQEIGTAGAQAYLAEATYSLTEVEGIEAVDFRFKPGDHAMPEVLTRSSFENFN